MTEFFQGQLDYIFFFYGLAFVLLAVVCASLRHDKSSELPWSWLALFGITHGLNEWLDMLVVTAGDSTAFSTVRVGIMILSFVFLIEFGRDGLKRVTGRGPGQWILLPLLALAVAGIAVDLTGMNVTARYALGLVGGAWAAVALFAAARRHKTSSRLLVAAGILMAVYAVTSGLIVPKAPFPPASAINHASFMAIAGFPVQLLRGLLAVLLAVTAWAYQQKTLRTSELLHVAPGSTGGLRLALAICSVVVAGWIATEIRSRHADSAVRDEIMNQTSIAAASLSIERVRHLGYNSSDPDSPDYLRLRKQLMDMQSASPKTRWYYLLGKRGQRMVFGPDSVPEGEYGHAAPGTPCYQPPALLSAVFEKGAPATIRPYRDESGSFVSIYVPILDPVSGGVLAVFGADVDAKNWQNIVAASRLPVIIITLLISILICGFFTANQSILNSTRQTAASEARLRGIVVTSNVGIAFTDVTGRIIDSNAAFRRITGLAEDEIRGRMLAECIHPDYATDELALFEALGRGERGQPYRKEKLLGRNGGRQAWVDMSMSIIRDAAGKPLHAAAMLVDITERKHAELALLDSERQFRNIIEFLPDATIVIDTAHKVIAWNKAMETMTGRKAVDMLGKGNYEYALPFYGERRPILVDLALEDHGEVIKRYTTLSRDGDMLRGEAITPALPGSGLCISATATTLRNSQGAIVGAIETMRDVTDARRADERNRYLVAMVNSSDDAIIGNTLDGEITSWNQGAETLYGYSAWEAIGAKLSLVVPEDRAEETASLIRRIRNGEHITHFETSRRRQDGSLIDISLTLSPIADKIGRIIGASSVARDITQMKKAEQALKEAKENAEAATRAKAEFLANMSHEIRTPMNGVVGMAGLLLGTPLSERQKHFAETIRNCGDSLLGIVNDILDFSKMEARKLVLEDVEYNLMDVVEGGLEIVAERAAAKKIELAGQVDAGVPTNLRGDPARVRQIILNLLSNAVKFTEHGGVSLRVSGGEDSADHVMLHFEVRDTGIGISPEGLANMFKAFSQADGSTTRKYGGTGLGLAISKQLVEMMGGTIGIDSQPGKGSRFWFTIRAGRVADAPAQTPAPNLANLRVLIVDDNATNREILESDIAGWRMRGASTADGEDALRVLRLAASDDPFDLAILDMQMPGMDGLMLAGTIKNDPVISRTRLLLISSLGSGPQTDELAMAGLESCLTKPVKQSQLYDQIARVMGKAMPHKIQPLAPTSRLPATTRRLKVLLAEDNPVNQEVTLSQLEKLGYAADLAADGREAVEAATKDLYDVIFMDCQMPELDGYEATRQIRLIEATRKRPQAYIVALTAHAMQGDREACLEAGMDDYISKPVRQSDIEKALETLESRDASPETDAEEPQAAVASHVDIIRLREATDGNPKRLRRMRDLYIIQAEETLSGLTRAIKENKAETVNHLAHRLAGASLTLGIDGMVPTMRQLESRGRDGSLGNAPELLEEAKREFETVRTALDKAVGF
ncbi:MAG: hypothetical protein C0404_03200 [Verrucomicrobia bacterium]|nr:hypothetical protein [Verrucomicrobiota bacterium]